MERDSDEEDCARDSDERIVTTPGGVEENIETFANYHMSQSKFQSTVIVRKYESKGLSFQLWPAANAVCWYLENEFGKEGMCISASASDEENSCLSSSADKGCYTPRESVHLPGVEEDNDSSRSKPGYYYRPPENRRMKVLELGSGTGMLGIVAACLGAHVILTDLPHVLPNAEYNMELNREIIHAAGGIVESHVLRWGMEEDVRSLGNLSSFDLILASDVVYYDTLFNPLLQTLKWLVGPAAHDTSSAPGKWENHPSNGVETQMVSPQISVSPIPLALACSEDDDAAVNQSASFSATAKLMGEENAPLNTKSIQVPVIFIGHVRRWKRDSHFFKKASKTFDVQVIHRHPPQENVRVGPVIYRLSVKPNCFTHVATSGKHL